MCIAVASVIIQTTEVCVCENKDIKGEKCGSIYFLTFNIALLPFNVVKQKHTRIRWRIRCSMCPKPSWRSSMYVQCVVVIHLLFLHATACSLAEASGVTCWWWGCKMLGVCGVKCWGCQTSFCTQVQDTNNRVAFQISSRVTKNATKKTDWHERNGSNRITQIIRRHVVCWSSLRSFQKKYAVMC